MTACVSLSLSLFRLCAGRGRGGKCLVSYCVRAFVTPCAAGEKRKRNNSGLLERSAFAKWWEEGEKDQVEIGCF